MSKRSIRILAAALILCSAAAWATNGGANAGNDRDDPASLPSREVHASSPAGAAELTPANTALLSDVTAQSFCQDFSPLLRDIGLEWILLEAAEAPEEARNKNLIIVGELRAGPVENLIAGLITPEEAAAIRQAGHGVLVRQSPWHAERVVYIAAGSDLPQTKMAAEEAVRAILAAARAINDWYRSVTTANSEELAAYLARFQHTPGDDELPLEALRMDFAAKLVLSISAAEAAEDVQRLFSLLSHGWAAYGYFDGEGRFDVVKARILGEIARQVRWSPAGLARLIRQQLSFVHDCHLNVDNEPFCGHADFWYDTSLEIYQTAGGYAFTFGDVEYHLTAINGESPERFLFPSLNARGDPVYRLGVLAAADAAPGPLRLTTDVQAPKPFEIRLGRSDRMLYRDAESRFGEERIGGIPVVRVRSFGDFHEDQLTAFLQTADRYRDEPYLILDIRGNTGGNDTWPRSWVARFTGYSPAYNTVDSELMSKTTRMGRVNSSQEMLGRLKDTGTSWYEDAYARFNAQAESFERDDQKPYWATPVASASHWIPNHTTLIVLTDGAVGSSGEGFIKFLWRQVENVILVGENSAGAVTFGQGTIHQLPHSRLRVRLPVTLIVRTDLVWLEERGYEPDLWVPAADALNFAVAAVRQGTISAEEALPPTAFETQFTPEKPLRRSWVREHSTGTGYKYELLAVALLAVPTGGMLVASRKRKLMPFLIGGAAFAMGVFYRLQGRSLGYLLLGYGGMLVAVGMFRWVTGVLAKKE